MQKSINVMFAVLFFTSLGSFVADFVFASNTPVIWERDGDVDALLGDASEVNPKTLPPTGSSLPLPANQMNGLKSLPASSDIDWMKSKTNTDKEDHEAEIFSFKGKVRVKKKGSDYWTPVYKRMRLQVGDEILTYKNSTLAAKYDQRYKDLIYISEKTHAVLESIEPTKIILEEGKIFHYLDAVIKNRNYQVVNKSTTLGIRGTHASTVFNPATGESFFGNFPTDDDHSSFIEVCASSGDSDCVDLGEGEGGSFTDEGDVDDENIDPLTQEQIDENQENLEEMENSDPNFALRNSDDGSGDDLPPTGGGLSDPGFIDPAGDGNVSGSNNSFDPLLDSGLDFADDAEPLFPEDAAHPNDDCAVRDDCGGDGYYG